MHFLNYAASSFQARELFSERATNSNSCTADGVNKKRGRDLGQSSFYGESSKVIKWILKFLLITPLSSGCHAEGPSPDTSEMLLPPLTSDCHAEGPSCATSEMSPPLSSDWHAEGPCFSLAVSTRKLECVQVPSWAQGWAYLGIYPF